MKYVNADSIVNMPDTDVLEPIFCMPQSHIDSTQKKTKIIFLADLLAQRKNTSLEPFLATKPSMYSNMYSENDEWEIFRSLANHALTTGEKIHIVWITLQKEIAFLEEYYTKLWYLREDIHCFRVPFIQPLITASVHIENLIWKGSDYKRMGEEIFFLPPIRSASETKAMFTGINRWVIAHIHIPHFSKEILTFLENCIRNESILPLTLAKVLSYHVQDIGIAKQTQEINLSYDTKKEA